ncbi:MAG: Gfo/Idh/MocA family oxidoreductase [Chloroflexi bacterium]|nr:Gfo/Idh/MocA family oxidoreductase [Chloroflexota bacterium]
MAVKPVRVGIVGCGVISGIYLKNRTRFPILDVVAIADALTDRAQARSQEFGVRAMPVDDLLDRSDVEIVLNLTNPLAHAEVTLRAIAAGRSVFTEKPLAAAREDGAKILAEGRRRGVRIGCAPDTVLGGGIQTCRAVLDSGAIGEPVAAVAFLAGHGPESWHPDPVPFYKAGAGPMFDMGPYYLSSLATLIGPVRRVSGATRISFPQRTITSQPKAGQKVDVEVPTHVTGVLDFVSGPVGTIVTSFDVWGHNLPRIEIYGAEGSLAVPDPNTFDGPVQIRRAGEREWREVPIAHGYRDNSRGIGLAEMATALRSGRPHRANGDLAYHVLDLMHAFHESSASGRHVEITSGVERPAPLPPGLPDGVFD